jgi:lipid II:glycine glycyltransferase (peptidoglycan interpeptide bridge formation enzyme)
MPYIYHSFPADEDIFALFRYNAKLIGRNVTSSIYLPQKIDFDESRQRSIKKALKNNLTVKRNYDFKDFMQILKEVLEERHGATPVHSLEEIELLAKKFPDNIRLFSSYKDDVMLAGVVVYESKNVAHAQYIANSNAGRDLGALELVFDYLINHQYLRKKYFDFGISTEQMGQFLNTGLIAHKEGFGARAVMQDIYELTVPE